jgi:hypothetical protein
LSNKDRAKRLNAITIGKNDNERCSAWWGWDGVQLKDFRFNTAASPEFGEIIDVGVGRLDPFDPSLVTTYPTFKNPRNGFDQGKSLCKLGFPFHQVQTAWDSAKGQFVAAPGSFPMPRFPLEGMFTRVMGVNVQGGTPPAFPIRYIETLTPGLRGQSGGPTFDVEGRIWAIQAKTYSIPLGLKGDQYLNVRLGVHPDTMFPFFDEAGIKYNVAD